MTYTQALLGFAVLAGAMSLVPGLDMMMTLNESIHYGRRNGIAASLGIQCGVLVWAVAAAAGLAALISAFPLAYDAIRVVGGLYLLYLGWTMSGASAWVRTKVHRALGRNDGGRGDGGASDLKEGSFPQGGDDAAGMMNVAMGPSVSAGGDRSDAHDAGSDRCHAADGGAASVAATEAVTVTPS